MSTPATRRLAATVTALLFAVSCSQPIEIIGQGDVVSESGTRTCTLEDHAAGAPNCTDNIVTGDYDETYSAQPRSGWHFHRWINYCADATTNECRFDLGSDIVDQAFGQTVPPLVAVFRPDVVTGFDSLFIGHSFFKPFALGMATHAPDSGFSDHTQSVVFSGGASGAPEGLWNNATKRGQIQQILDEGDVELFGMTYHPTYPSLTGYRNWIDYALEANPDTRIFIALPWLTDPGSFEAEVYRTTWLAAHDTLFHGLIDDLRAEYPRVDIYGIPYGQAAAELYSLYDAGQLPDVDTLVSPTGEAIFRDSFGHADDILVELGRLVWLRAIYGVDLSTYDYDPGYTTDLKAIADAIMDGHDPAYDAPAD